MTDRTPTDEQLAAALASLGRDLAFPRTPLLTTAVMARLTVERAGGAHPRLPGLALLGRRRLLVLVAVGLLALLGIAATARLVIGAIEIRVQPGATPSASVPPVRPDALGKPLPGAEAVARAGFEPALPPGPRPAAVYVIETDFGGRGLLYAWRPSPTYPRIEGTGWGLLLITAQGRAEFATKTVNRFDALVDVEVNGHRAFWIPAPHEISIQTKNGAETFAVRGNVLIWQVGHITYRLEGSLGRAEAVGLAESMT